MQTETQRDRMFRQFQIHKYRAEGMVPTVNMTVLADVTRLFALKAAANAEAGTAAHITITHLVTKAVSDTLQNYSLLFGFFTGGEVIENQELAVCIPVDTEQHVEYIVLRSPNQKSVSEIAAETEAEREKIKTGEGTFLTALEKMMGTPDRENPDPLEFCRKYLGNFPISNFGSFHADQGAIVIAKPVVSGLCIGAARTSVCCRAGLFQECILLPLTISFDHRPVDGAYAGKFLNSVRELLEHPEPLFSKQASAGGHIWNYYS